MQIANYFRIIFLFICLQVCLCAQMITIYENDETNKNDIMTLQPSTALTKRLFNYSFQINSCQKDKKTTQI